MNNNNPLTHYGCTTKGFVTIDYEEYRGVIEKLEATLARLAEVEKERDEAREHNIKLYKNASKEICDLRQIQMDESMERFKLQYGNIKVGPDPYEIIEGLKAELLAAKAVVEAARDVTKHGVHVGPWGLNLLTEIEAFDATRASEEKK